MPENSLSSPVPLGLPKNAGRYEVVTLMEVILCSPSQLITADLGG